MMNMVIDNSIFGGLNISIPEQLRTGQFRFIRLKRGGKEPVDKWTTPEFQYTYADPVLLEWLKNGGNYGVVCVSGDVCIIDADNYIRLDSLGSLDSMQDTFLVRTGGSDGEHYHYFIKCSGLGVKKLPFYDLINTDEHLGEVYPAGCPAYCCGPGCLHPSGQRYVIVNDAPIKRVTAEELDKSFFSKVKSSRISPERIEQLMQKMPTRMKVSKSTLTIDLGLRIENFAMPIKAVRRGDEYQGSHPIHGSTTGQNFSINVKKNVWYCFRDNSYGDPITFLAVKHGFIRCDDAGSVDITGEMFLKIKALLSSEYGYKDQIEKLDSEFKGIEEITKDELNETNNNQGLRYEPILPDDHFLTRYADTICEMTDSYRDYQYAAGITLLSMMMQRKAFLFPTHGKIYPNVWNFLLGASSYSKKTTAIRFARGFCNEICPYTSIGNDLSPERFAQDVSEHHSCYQFIDEVSSLLAGMKKKSYMSSYREMLCAFYDDEPYKMGRSKRGRPKKDGQEPEQNEWIIKDTYINLLFATTPDAFGENTVTSDMTSGMFYRFLFFYPRYDKTIMPTNMRTSEQEKALKELFYRLSKLYDYFNSNDLAMLEFQYSPDALQYLQDWETRNTDENHKRGNKMRESAFSRMSINAQKLGMIFEAGTERFYKRCVINNMVMAEGETYQIGLDMIKEVLRQVDTYFMPVFEEIATKICQSESQTIQEKILKHLEDNGGRLPVRSLRQKIRVNRRSDWDEAIHMLTSDAPEGTGEVRMAYVTSDTTKKKTQYAILTNGGDEE